MALFTLLNRIFLYPLYHRCPEDETLKIERFRTGQKLTFKTFKFAHAEDALLYLHCDILACTSTSTCGTCIKRWKNISALWIRSWKNRVRKQMVFDVTTIQREIFSLLEKGLKLMKFLV